MKYCAVWARVSPYNLQPISVSLAACSTSRYDTYESEINVLRSSAPKVLSSDDDIATWHTRKIEVQ